ncbi:MAG: zinc-ribbon domain-containing protein [Oscillospiraceae bacterium]|nr:zinc-ribbon domain-containing protein [Oscillospiraceae bacterium]
MSESLREYCFRFDRGELLLQWHPEKNGRLTPDQVSYGSQRKVWWRCSRGHEWQSPPYARAGKNSGCPYCAGKKLAPEMGLGALYPDIAKQWHDAKNGVLTPEQVLPGSHKPVWWRCEHGHEWKALVKSRVEGSGCPVCANRVAIPGVNDLTTTDPELAKQWHPGKNGSLTPEQVLGGSSRKVWWRCSWGHEWQAAIHSRVYGRGCPVCTGKTIVPGVNDLESYSPQLARQWLREKNGALTPDRVSIYSNKRVWWRCDRGHEWQSAISSRTDRQSGCPYCGNRKVLAGFNDLKTVEPMVAAQWHPTLNAPLEPTMVMPGSAKRVWWRCIDGHEWKAVIYSRTGSHKCGCPVCGGRSAKRR